MIELTASDGHKFSAYRADPIDAPKGAVVVVQEVFGVNSHIRKLADAFAAKGYVAIAPALFDSVKPGVELGYDEDSLTEGLSLMQQVGTERSLGDIQATVDAVKNAGKVAVVGYCWGGYLAYLSGNRVNGIACAIGYYGGGIVDEYRAKRKVPTLLHFCRERCPDCMGRRRPVPRAPPRRERVLLSVDRTRLQLRRARQLQRRCRATGAETDLVLDQPIRRGPAADPVEERRRLRPSQDRQEKEEERIGRYGATHGLMSPGGRPHAPLAK
jgi:dienelactone hydrolase